MPLDINGALIKSSNTALNITTNSILGLDVNTFGFPTQAKRPFFMAVDSLDGWYQYPNGGWTNIVLNTVVKDNTNSYTPSNGRFTAPVSGTYAFQASTYVNKSTAVASNYVHPIFRINDSYTIKQASRETPYRLRVRTYYDGGYSADTQINDIFYLSAGDYVNLHHYSSAAQQWYGTQSFFSGFLIG